MDKFSGKADISDSPHVSSIPIHPRTVNLARHSSFIITNDNISFKRHTPHLKRLLYAKLLIGLKLSGNPFETIPGSRSFSREGPPPLLS
jgi:hypothetical protein